MFDSLVTPWTVARQAPLSMGFSRQENWSGLPFPPPRDLPDPGMEPRYPALAGRFFTTEPPRKPVCVYVCVCVYIYSGILLLLLLSHFSHVQLCATP